MNTSGTSTLPKPFIFILMPFDPKFNDIYKFGIKGAANEVGAYADRIDEQIFTEGILDRIFNQISKADVIVADMTGRNPNVFYEVGYAHALGKTVLLLTQDTDDIPFDLKHRQHIVYGGSIDKLKSDLITKLQWAIAESRKKLNTMSVERFSLSLLGTLIPKSGTAAEVPVIEGILDSNDFGLPFQLRNESFETASAIRYVYLFCEQEADIVPCDYEWARQGASAGFTTFLVSPMQVPYPLPSFVANPLDAPDGLNRQFRLKLVFQELPAGAVETSQLNLMFSGQPKDVDSLYRMRLHTERQSHDFTFRLAFKYNTKKAKNSPSESAN